MIIMYVFISMFNLLSDYNRFVLCIGYALVFSYTPTVCIGVIRLFVVRSKTQDSAISSALPLEPSKSRERRGFPSSSET